MSRDMAPQTRRALRHLREDADRDCYICGSWGQEIHHTSYYPEETVILCTDCHHELHETGEPEALYPDLSVRPDNYDEKRRDGVNSLDEELEWLEAQR